MEEYDTDQEQLAQEQSDQSVIAYLRDHPQFFVQHPDVLGDLDIPHPQGEGAVSLIERQVQALRDRQQRERQHLENLIVTARDNERVAERLHRLAVEVTSLRDLDNALSTVPHLVQELFDVRHVALRVESESDHGLCKELVNPNDPSFIEVRARVTHGRSVSDDRLPAPMREYLFGESGAAVESCMLVPVGGRQPLGVLALGSELGERFQADQGTLYLDRLGDLVGALMRRLLG